LSARIGAQRNDGDRRRGDGDFTDQFLLVDRDAAEFLFPVPAPTSCGTSDVSL
jgi:hypothetical protein